ncbi:DUF481 domain-containing protein [Agaribacterium haliotis]|uniref:DUF481 domain-containing protein n=1 Tax=Agaribacterium haliotis TaxID=2013869 RepID=UPI000BB530F5|nr:DUF481 domain-containing protein [Agaribacterium haliotis]
MKSQTLCAALALSGTWALTSQAQVAVPDYVSQAVNEQQQSLPPARQWDWLQLTSGEWLKGDVKVLYSDSLEFDSDEMGLNSFDLEDVAYLKTSHIQAVRVMGHKNRLIGYVSIEGDELIISYQGDTQRYPKDSIIAMVSGAPKASNYWRIRASVGTNYRTGNSPSTEFNGKFNAKRRTTLSRFTLDYLGVYSEAQEVETANNNRISSAFDIFATDQVFYRPFYLDLYQDTFQNIKARGTLGAGIGRTAYNTSETELDFFIGPGWQFSHFDEVQEGEQRQEDSVVGIASMNLDKELSDSVDFIYNYRIQWADMENGGYTHHMLSTLEYELTGSIDIDITYVWDYIQNPKAGEDGVQPKSDDNRLMFSISYEFN